MSEKTGIEWTDSTFNPWIGCAKVSPGCDNCYAERDWDLRRHRAKWGAGQARSRTAPAYWKEPLRWNAKRFFRCNGCGWRGDTPNHWEPDALGNCPECNSFGLTSARRRVFCASLADVFDNEVNPEWREDLFALIRSTPNLDWLLLTKRIGNAGRMMMEANGFAGLDAEKGWIPMSNVWIGATMVDQSELQRDILKLLNTPAVIRFVSIEPMLGQMEVTRFHNGRADGFGGAYLNALNPVTGVDWVICGGESGPGARPMHPDWVRSLRDQCADAGVAFLFKQWGEWLGLDCHSACMGWDPLTGSLIARVDGKDFKESAVVGWTWHGDLHAVSVRVGKKAAGRLLDGVQHDGYPA